MWEWIFFIPFPFPNLGNRFFHSLPIPEFWECLFFIPFPFPNLGNWFFPFPSRSRTSGMELSIPVPVPELPNVIPAHPWFQIFWPPKALMNVVTESQQLFNRFAQLTPLSVQISASEFKPNSGVWLKRSLKILKWTQHLKTQSNFWCRGVNNKHHAAERWDLEFGFQTPPLRSVMFAIKYCQGKIQKVGYLLWKFGR